ncbi:nuclear transport factor 2 family protein [Hymenobacter sp. BT491]|uniref:nuclear transport factor 2 family protein n=1 Tax=Hymenobacter sp. BT491 TaxID=2766779 RepID=UPI001653A206|nr:nuclear transport factor 2 family protein [Hymenobacter sp. BT491]MBC6991030.1 hypothetical protein [Hymenobacter sp. BT491]
MENNTKKAVEKSITGYAMFRRALLAAVLLILPASLTMAQTNEDEVLKSVIRNETSAYFKRDAKAWQATWLQEQKATRTIIGNGRYFTVTGGDKIRDDILKDIKDNPKNIPVQVTSRNFLISNDGNMAWVEYDQTLMLPTLDPKYKSETREQRLLLKRGNQWKIANQITTDKSLGGSDPKAIEASLSSVGYRLMAAKRMKEAIDVFKMNASLNPQSADAFDSLAEAYMKAGNKTLAVQNYERSLRINPASESGKEALAKLKQK